MADLLIQGYASIFHVMDDGRDIILPGAFARALKAGKPALLWQHDPKAPAGRIETMREDAHGLFIKARVDTKLQAGAVAASLVRAGRVDGLSIGFRPRMAATDPYKKQRLLRDVDLVEVSLVHQPMQRLARITGFAEAVPDLGALTQAVKGLTHALAA